MPTVVFATNPYLEPLLDGAAEFARAHDWNFVTSMRRTGQFPVLIKPDAILATIVGDELAKRLAGFSCPIVQMLKTGAGARLPYPVVMADYRALGELGARHLLSLGRPHLGFYRRFSSPDSTAIRDGFEQAMAVAGRTVQRLDFPEEYPGAIEGGPGQTISEAEWHERLGARLAVMTKPCAIMAEDDRFGIALVQLALKLGLRVPQEVAVLGCDNLLADVRLSPVPLSSVDANLESVGYQAAQLVQNLLEGGTVPDGPVIVPPRGLVARESTAMYVCEDARIAGVVCRIRTQFREPLPISQLAREAGISVRLLQAGFKAVTGRSVRDELNRCRMECAERLLGETDLKVAAIAAESGFGDAKSLARFFHLKHDITPVAFRLRARRSQHRGK
jgi:LacI family transcriptional regulator